MIRALFSAASGMNAQQTNIENIANNLANSNTTGYKARRAQFQDLLYQTMTAPGTQASQQTFVPAGLQLGLGTRAASNEIIFTQGDFSETDNPLDVVIQGLGFFQIQQPTGVLAYTRAGNFQLDQNGNVVNSSGYPVVPRSPFRLKRSPSPSPGRHGQLYPPRPVRGPDRRTDPARRLPQSRRTQQHRRQLYLPTDASGNPIVRAPGSAAGGHAAARLYRAVQRQRGGRVHQYDRGAARLRSEFQGRQSCG